MHHQLTKQPRGEHYPCRHEHKSRFGHSLFLFPHHCHLLIPSALENALITSSSPGFTQSSFDKNCHTDSLNSPTLHFVGQLLESLTLIILQHCCNS